MVQLEPVTVQQHSRQLVDSSVRVKLPYMGYFHQLMVCSRGRRKTSKYAYKYTNTHTLFGKQFQETGHEPGLKMRKLVKNRDGNSQYYLMHQYKHRLQDLCTLNLRFLFCLCD